MTNEELDRLQRISDGATAGPWGISGAHLQFIDSDPKCDRSDTIICEMWSRNAFHGLSAQGEADLVFIMTARTAMPALIAEVRRLQERCEAAEAGEEMRPANEWHEDHGWALWWLVPDDGSNLDEYPFFGNPLCSDWEERPFEPTHYTRVKVREPMRRGPQHAKEDK